MSFMETMRRGADSTAMQVVLALVLVSFIGFTAVPSGEKTSVVAIVDGDRIMATEYFRELRERTRAIEVSQQRTLSDAEQQQVADMVRQNLIEDVLVRQEAARLGVEVSDAEVARTILRMPELTGDDGKYSPEVHKRFLKRAQYTEDDFNERVRDKLLQDKLRQLVFMGASVSEPAVREAFIDANTLVTLDIVRVRPAAFLGQVTIDAAERDTWLKDNEVRVREAYDRDFERMYNHPEQVRLSVIKLAVLPDGPQVTDLLPRMKAIETQLANGADFAELARHHSEDPSAALGGTVGLRPMAQLPTEVSTALQGVAPGGRTAVLSTTSEVMIYRLDERLPARVDAFEDVKAAIAERILKDERVPALAAAFAENELLPRWKADGTPPLDLMAPLGLVVASRGPMPARGAAGGLPESLVKKARVAAVGAVIDEVAEEGGDLFGGQLRAREDADLATYDVQKETLRETVLEERRVAFYTGWVASLQKKAVIE